MDHSTHWHILIIDDSPDDRAEFKHMLITGSGRTCHIAEAELADAGLNMILEKQAHSLAGTTRTFDCVLLDFNLPDQNGTQFLTALCESSGMPPCPVVVITGWESMPIKEGIKLLQAGAQDYIGKSWTSPQSLCRAIENSIDRFKLQQTHEQTRQSLVTSQERYRTLFDSIDEGYCIIEMMFDAHDHAINYRFLEINQAFERQSGLTGALGKTILELIPEIETKWLQTYGQVALTGEPIRMDDYVAQINRWFDVYAFRFGDPAKRQLGVLFSNISVRKGLEAQLNDALAEAERANCAKSEFLTCMSHELRTPLHGILGFAQLMELSAPPPSPAQQQSLSHIISAGWFLLDLINDTLDLSAIEAGKIIVSAEIVSLDAVLLECDAIIRPLAEKRNLTVSYPVQNPQNLTYADPVRLKQVLLNLLSNSIKYNREGGCIDVRCEPMIGQRLRISVQDTGLGMTPTQQAHLFEVFNRLGLEHSGIDGAGLGLFMCKRLVELMGGQIGVDSVPGEGSHFWFELPLARQNTSEYPLLASQAVEARHKLFEHLPVPLPDVSRALKLLHVDDNPANLDLVAQMLAQRPERMLLSVSHGSLRVEIARAHLPAVILMDTNLPGSDGIETLKILKADPATMHIPVIALSANAKTLDIQSGLEAGFFRYVKKPIRVRELLNAVDDAQLFSQRVPQSPPPPSS